MNRSIFCAIVAGLAILLLLSMLMPVFVPGSEAAFPFSFARWCMGPGYFLGSGLWLFPLFMLIVILFVIYQIFGRGDFHPLWQDSGRYRDTSESPETALDILKKRYARGEISKEEFEKIKKDSQ